MGTPTRSRAPPPRPPLRPRDRHRSAPDSALTTNPAPAPPLVPGELVEYLESGRRPRRTNESIVPLMTSPPEDPQQHPPSPAGGPAGSVRAPTGHSRPPLERGGGLDHDGTPPRDRGPERTEQDRPAPKEVQGRDGGRDFVTGDQLGDPEVKRDWANSRAGGGGGGEGGRGKGGYDGLLSFIRAGFLKWDGQKRTNGSPARLTLSNGQLEGKLNGAPGGPGRDCADLANGGAGRGSAEIRRSQSSSNIHARLPDSTPPPAQNHGPAPPLRPCQSTTSLGRKRPPFESRM